MIDFYALTSPNVQKIYIMLEECALPYKEHFVDVWKGDQFKPEFLKLNPNGKVPTLVDGEVVVWESNTILRYLCGKSAGGTARFAIPQFTACSALTGSPSTNISNART